jgi:arylsulfatase
VRLLGPPKNPGDIEMQQPRCGNGRILQLVLRTTAVVSLLLFTALLPLHAQEKRPNILLIVADDMGWSDAGVYGGEIFTPNLNRLASQGYQFLNFHVGSMCAPTRSMLMTGMDNHVVGLGNMVELLADNQRGKPGYEGKLNGRAVTIATILRDAGYHTYMAGKWHLGYTKETIPACRDSSSRSYLRRAAPTTTKRSRTLQHILQRTSSTA